VKHFSDKKFFKSIEEIFEKDSEEEVEEAPYKKVEMVTIKNFFVSEISK
jgi:hypothetical protein